MPSKRKTGATASALPGRAVRGSKSGRPIMALLDLLGRRWTLRIIWELRAGPRGFRELRALCDGMSPSTLSTRIRELEDAGFVDHTPDGDLTLTDVARSAEPLMLALLEWSNEWAAHMRKKRKTIGRK
ncbi:MAG: helix-turn-helix domain-containing protein [Myxococcota bacterium]